MYRIPGDDYIENIIDGRGEVTDTYSVAHVTHVNVSDSSGCSVTQNIIKSTEDKVTPTIFRSFGTVSNKLNCSICFTSIRHRQVSCAKCTTQWCVPCYMMLSIANTHIIKCPICRFVSQPINLNRFRINSLGL